MRKKEEGRKNKEIKKKGKEKVGFGEEKDKIFWQIRISCAVQATRTRGVRVRADGAYMNQRGRIGHADA